MITSRLSHSLRERGYPDFSAFLDHLLKSRTPLIWSWYSIS
ncbi:MAG: hypothetical protein ACLRNQ_01795 [Flavonifractor plautii]